MNRKQLGLVLLLFIAVLLPNTLRAQMLIGSSGQLNIPTATLRPAGTFDGGVRFISKNSTNGVYNFNTGLYYVTFSPFSFVELTLRETLLYTSKVLPNLKPTGEMGYFQQDRSTSARLRLLPEVEGRWWPAVAAGVNDLYSRYGVSEYAGVYGVMTKHFDWPSFGRLGATVGYVRPIAQGHLYKGAFGGVEFKPAALQNLALMAEYDSYGVNVGASYLLWNALHLFAYTNELRGFAAGLSYQHTIKF